MNRSFLMVLSLTILIIGVLIFFKLLTVWWVVALAAVIAASLALADNLWAFALLVPLSAPIGRVGTIIVGQSYRYEITATEVVILALSATLLYAIAWGNIRLSSVPPMERVWYGMLAVAYGSILWIADGAKYLVGVRLLTYQFLSFLIAFTLIRSSRRRWASLWAMAVAAAVIAIQLLWTLSQYPSIQKYFAQRSLVETPVGPMAFVVAIVVLLLPFAIMAGYRHSGTLRYMAWASAAVAAAAVVASVGRTALLVVLVSSWYLFWRMGRGWKFVKRLAVVAAIGLVLGGGSGLPTVVFERFSGIASSTDSAQFRIEEARTGLTVFRRHLFLGAGAGNLKYYYQRLFNGYSGESNNIIVQMAGEYGLVGLGLLLGWVVAIRRTVRALGSHALGRDGRLMLMGFQTSIIAAALHGMLEVTFFGLLYGALFWYLMGVLAAWGQERR